MGAAQGEELPVQGEGGGRVGGLTLYGEGAGGGGEGKPEVFGVGEAETIWIIDPETRTARVCSGKSWIQAPRLEVAGSAIYVEIDELFAILKDLADSGGDGV